MNHARLAAAALFAGLLFGLGLALAGMTQPAKVTGFLDLGGDWDASLMFVMVGAIAVHAPLRYLILRRQRPLLAGRFDLPTTSAIDWRLLAGAAIFGVGWGLVGICPGPALVAAATGATKLLAFVAAMAVGMLGFAAVQARLGGATRAAAPALTAADPGGPGAARLGLTR